jgi:hypothetical protein
MNNIKYLPRFRIKSVHKTKDHAYITIVINKILWEKQNKGMLYGVDISNEVYRLHPDIMAHCPSVDDTARAKNGFKTISLRYEMRKNYAK